MKYHVEEQTDEALYTCEIEAETAIEALAKAIKTADENTRVISVWIKTDLGWKVIAQKTFLPNKGEFKQYD